MEEMLQLIRDMMGHTSPPPTTFPEHELESIQAPTSLPSHVQVQEHCPNGQNRAMEQKWQRIRWTDEMVRVLMTAASYVDGPHDQSKEGIHVKGKWKCISKTMIERGYTVSHQQCEDKFNDMNKRYKRLKHILGTNTACEVVENTAVILETMNLPEGVKDEVRKILTCKQLFFREMCSYHNRDRRFLPHDPSIQQSVMSNCLNGRLRYCSPSENSAMIKRQKLGEDVNEVDWGWSSDWMRWRWVHLEERKMEIDKKRLELEKKKLEWLEECEDEDEELEDMKLQNQLMKIQNQHLAILLQSRQTAT